MQRVLPPPAGERKPPSACACPNFGNGRAPGELGILRNRRRTADQEAMDLIAFFAREEGELLFGLDAFNDDRQIEPAAEPNDARMMAADCGLRSRFAIKA